ncbi:hypothetical protein [Oscillibacter sp.]|uniref:hypothetical protein n=1 Tax=Oscillibacter sp. TaxID=1945593 RepID=UPI0025CFDF88|nr:hypothetical protein [Oscillibacter sp.]
MKFPIEYEKYKQIPPDCPIYDKNNPDYRCSVDYDKTNYRKNKAIEEHKKEKVEISKISKLIEDFLKPTNIESECIVLKGIDILLAVNYEIIKRQYNLNNQSDLVWLRFTDDGYLGVVASSNDINFDQNTNSFKLINHIKQKWDENLILIVPLPGIYNKDERVEIEKMIGNYLIEKKVPIIDYYSHMSFAL